MTRSTGDRLTDILHRIRAIGVAEALMTSEESAVAETAFDAILYDLLVIGEAVKALPDAVRSTYESVPWSDIARMRDILAHHYFKVGPDVVHATIDKP